MSEPDYNYYSPVLSDYESSENYEEHDSDTLPDKCSENEPRLILNDSSLDQDLEEQEVSCHVSSPGRIIEANKSCNLSVSSPKIELKRLYSPPKENVTLNLLDTCCSSSFKAPPNLLDTFSENKRQKQRDFLHRSDETSEIIGFDCPICLTEFKNRTYLEPCFHQFCFLCISSYIGTCYPNTLCPLCKQHFTKVYHSYKKVQDQIPYQEITESSSTEKPSKRVYQKKGNPMHNFKVATCTELYQTPVLKAVKSLKELCFELNKRESKTSRDRQLIYEYSLLPCYSATTSKRLAQELAKVPYTTMDSLNLTGLLYDEDVKDDNQFYSFLKRDLAAILFINHPLYPDSLLNLTIRQILSTLVFNSKKNPDDCTFDYRCHILDDYISPYGQLFLKELTGFVISPFFTSSNSIQQFDKWIKYEEPRLI